MTVGGGRGPRARVATVLAVLVASAWFTPAPAKAVPAGPEQVASAVAPREQTSAVAPSRSRTTARRDSLRPTRTRYAPYSKVRFVATSRFRGRQSLQLWKRSRWVIVRGTTGPTRRWRPQYDLPDRTGVFRFRTLTQSPAGTKVTGRARIRVGATQTLTMDALPSLWLNQRHRVFATLAPTSYRDVKLEWLGHDGWNWYNRTSAGEDGRLGSNYWAEGNPVWLRFRAPATRSQPELISNMVLARPRRMPRVVVTGGGAWPYPEHTMAALDRAIGQGVDEIEVGVQWSAEGTPFAFGAIYPASTTDAETLFPGRAFDSMSSFRDQEIQSLDAGIVTAPQFAGQRVPRMDLWLDRLAGRTAVTLDLSAALVRDPEVDARLEALLANRRIKELQNEGRLAIATADTAWLERFKQTHPHVKVSLVTDDEETSQRHPWADRLVTGWATAGETEQRRRAGASTTITVFDEYETGALLGAGADRLRTRDSAAVLAVLQPPTTPTPVGKVDVRLTRTRLVAPGPGLVEGVISPALPHQMLRLESYARGAWTDQGRVVTTATGRFSFSPTLTRRPTWYRVAVASGPSRWSFLQRDRGRSVPVLTSVDHVAQVIASHAGKDVSIAASAGLERVLAQGADGVQVSLDVSSDGTVFVVEEAVLDAWTDSQAVFPGQAPRRLSRMTAAEVRQLTVLNGGGPVLTLAEYARQFGGRGELGVESVWPSEPSVVAALGVLADDPDVSSLVRSGRLTFRSKNVEVLRTIDGLLPGVQLAVLGRLPAEVPEGSAWIDRIYVSGDHVAEARALGLVPIGGGVAASAPRSFDEGLDQVITNDVVDTLAVLHPVRPD